MGEARYLVLSGKVRRPEGDTIQWLIIARDGADKDALSRRLKARPAHLERQGLRLSAAQLHQLSPMAPLSIPSNAITRKLSCGWRCLRVLAMCCAIFSTVESVSIRPLFPIDFRKRPVHRSG